jgi:phage-related holin
MKFLFKSFWYFIIQLLAYIESGTRVQKIEASIFLAVLSSPLAYLITLFNKYVLTDKGFAEILFIFILGDLVTGGAKHLKLRNFSFKLMFTGLLEKIFVSIVGLVLFNALSLIEGLQQHETILDYFKVTGKLINAFYVGGSAFNNLYVLSGGKFPPLGWMKRMKSFNITGNLDELSKAQEAGNAEDLKTQAK